MNSDVMCDLQQYAQCKQNIKYMLKIDDYFVHNDERTLIVDNNILQI